MIQKYRKSIKYFRLVILWRSDR